METQYNRKEMEDRLPDYIFGRLGADEVEIFDRSVANFPDLAQEIKDTRAVFARMERIDINRISSERTRNLGPSVNSRLRQRSESKRSLGTSFRFAIPALALLTVAYVFIFRNDATTTEGNATFSKSDAEAIIENVSSADDIDSVMLQCALPELVSGDLADLADEEGLSQEIEYSFIENIAENTDQSLSLLSGDMTPTDLIDEMDDWTEDDFQEFLQEIQNEKANS